MTKSSNTTTQEIIFNAELWIYQRKSAFPMVDCLPGPANGLWEKFNYHPVCNGIVLQDKDVLVLGLDGAYTVKSKSCDQDIQKQALIAEIEIFKTESIKAHVVKVWADSYENSDPFGYAIMKNNKVWWMKTQAHQLWEMWQAAKAQAIPEGFVLVRKPSGETWSDGAFDSISDDFRCNNKE